MDDDDNDSKPAGSNAAREAEEVEDVEDVEGVEDVENIEVVEEIPRESGSTGFASSGNHRNGARVWNRTKRLDARRVGEVEKDTSDVVGYLIEMEILDQLGEVLDQDPERRVTVHGPGGAFQTCTPLMYAVYKSRIKTVAFLLERGADVSMRSASEVSVLGMACAGGCPKIAELLVSHGAKLHTHDENDAYALEKLFECGGTTFLESVFSQGGVAFGTSSEQEDKRYEWCLCRACELSSLTLVKCRIDQGVDVNATGHGVTPLTRACELGEVAIARELVERGAEVDLLTSGGKSATTHACDQEKVNTSVVKAVQFLLTAAQT